MKKQIIGSLTSILVLTIAFSSIQVAEAVYHTGHDGSVEEYLEKVVVKPMKGKKDMWTYIVKACATDHNLAITAVILKSDIDEKVLGVNKTIKKGECSTYGATMNAKDGKTLGAELIEKHEALQKFNDALNSDSAISKSEQQERQKEITKYRILLGGRV
ncbi:hypothetical protein NKOR_08135 [Candidatus Nitrosopumilus koreensis AR1]|uniref:Uncharacterized protein n=1 Tax=Candidatus Nitrosopumilus koreensis AR1 TaxID=1229908 RepID=K0B5M9_9ARCH|nr:MULTISPECIES: hypothetical protein [Nitrosopumilus]AFS81488.1 hypothetical protein NKOR_08135 [Candidatus Nitrosopumilus koreensis AR1]